VIHLLSDTICFQDSVNLEVFTENGWGPIQLIAPPNYVQAGNLELQFSDAEGCSWTQNFYVTELSEIQYTNNYFGSDTITAEVTPIGGLPPYQIIWMDSTIGYSHTFMESGNYSFSIYDGFNCESQGIAEITIVPNFISPLNINHDFFITNEIIYSSNIINHFTVYDATGQIVMQFQLTENDSKSLSSLAKGIYFISNGRNMCRFIR
jgi:hypothetical protein